MNLDVPKHLVWPHDDDNDVNKDDYLNNDCDDGDDGDDGDGRKEFCALVHNHCESCLCGCVAVWLCGRVAVWLCDYVTM